MFSINLLPDEVGWKSKTMFLVPLWYVTRDGLYFPIQDCWIKKRPLVAKQGVLIMVTLRQNFKLLIQKYFFAFDLVILVCYFY